MTVTKSTHEVELAGLGLRALAAIVDMAILALFWAALTFVIRGAELYRVDISIETIANLFGVVFVVLYFFVSEGLWSATPAKLLIGLQVVSEDDGRPIDWSMSMLRNLLRPVDWLPTLYFAGFLFAVNSPKTQRLGDRVARTVVIRI